MIGEVGSTSVRLHSETLGPSGYTSDHSTDLESDRPVDSLVRDDRGKGRHRGRPPRCERSPSLNRVFWDLLTTDSHSPVFYLCTSVRGGQGDPSSLGTDLSSRVNGYKFVGVVVHVCMSTRTRTHIHTQVWYKYESVCMYPHTRVYGCVHSYGYNTGTRVHRCTCIVCVSALVPVCVRVTYVCVPDPGLRVYV